MTSEIGSVVAIDQESKTRAVRIDDDALVRTLEADEIGAGRLAHAYAVTVHRSHGSTVERAHSLEEGGGRQLAYVKMGPAKTRSTVYVVADSPEQAAEDLRREWAMEQRPAWVIDSGTTATDSAAVEVDVRVADECLRDGHGAPASGTGGGRGGDPAGPDGGDPCRRAAPAPHSPRARRPQRQGGRYRGTPVGQAVSDLGVANVNTSSARSATSPSAAHARTSQLPHRARDATASNRVVTLNKRLAGPVPYRGGDVDLQLALLSVKASDLAAPYLEVLEQFASVAGIAFVAPALKLAAPLRRGLDLLVGADEPAVLEVGLATTFLSPETGLYCLVAAAKQELTPSGLRVDETYQLLDASGRPIADYAYVVLSIEAQDRRDDWPALPGVREAYQDLMRAVEKADFGGVKDALGAFRRVAITSPDLLAADASRLANMVTNEVSLALGAVGTGRGSGSRIRPLQELHLYPSSAT